jgi:hypothetical protein
MTLTLRGDFEGDKPVEKKKRGEVAISSLESS